MPAHYITYAGGTPILPVTRASRSRRPASVRLDAVYLSSFGEMRVPHHLWWALQRFDVWIEPALIAEWIRLMKAYAAGQGRTLDDAVIATATAWSEPLRDVRIAREEALRLLARGPLTCVWSGRHLTVESLDIDHCFPWTFWPCDDLWNLLPAHRIVNQRQKRDRLPGEALLRASRDRISQWWETGYLSSENPALRQRFREEAKGSLPSLGNTEFSLDDVFTAVSLQRVRLKSDQQIPEWMPKDTARASR
jgi:hypothetical protein